MPAAARAWTQSTRLSHSDKVGEAIALEEARHLLNVVYDIVQGQVRALPPRCRRCSGGTGRPPRARLAWRPRCSRDAARARARRPPARRRQDNARTGKGPPVPHPDIAGRAPGDAVVGSQPVSLDRANLVLLQMKRYFVTWKADGTRYLILLTRCGTYLVDRAGEVRRRWVRPAARRRAARARRRRAA